MVVRLHAGNDLPMDEDFKIIWKGVAFDKTTNFQDLIRKGLKKFSVPNWQNEIDRYYIHISCNDGSIFE